MSESESIEQIDIVLGDLKDLKAKSVEHPMVFSGPIELAPEDLAEQAAKAAAMREFMAEQVSKARRLAAIAEAMHIGRTHDFETVLDQVMVDQAQNLIARGHAWPERRAKANLSVLEDRVTERGIEVRLVQVRSLLREIEDCYQAWRDTEFAIDRQARLLQLRHAIGEV